MEYGLETSRGVLESSEWRALATMQIHEVGREQLSVETLNGHAIA